MRSRHLHDLIGRTQPGRLGHALADGAKQRCAQAQNTPALKKTFFHTQIGDTHTTNTSPTRHEIQWNYRSGVSATEMLVTMSFVYGGKPMASFTAEYSG